MPELPEVETVRRGLEAAIVGQAIERVTLRRANLRYPFPAHLEDKLAGKTVMAIRRRAKYLLFDIGEHTLIGHLGMTGTYLVRDEGQHLPQPHDHMLWTLKGGLEVVYHDPRRFGFLLQAPSGEADIHPLLNSLGVEPLSKELNETYLQGAMAHRHTPIKSFLLDQRFIAGLGNIYVCEALFIAGIHPEQPATDCVAQAEALIKAVRKVLLAALDSGGSTLRNYANASGGTGYFQHHFNVYGRAGKPCLQCATPIQRIKQAGRSTFFCPSCQGQNALNPPQPVGKYRSCE